MEQVTLYRKYRPIDFDTVVGQDAIVNTLKNQIVNNQISHAYLFCGTRGTGKTTVAKIFARAVNCVNKKTQDANPCNNCDICKNILENKDININELDAAANNGIDDIRNIINQTEYPPSNNEKYKVFIIDEAHELSDKARDAFLKTLEEPPSYVIFILCTTEPYKFKQTILSRCQRYDFKRISIDNITKNLKNICEKENINIDEDALIFIAKKSDGSMRESISLLDRVKSFNDENVDLKIVEEILGIADDKNFLSLTISIINENVSDALNIINTLINDGKDLTVLVSDYIWYLRNILIIKNMDKANDILSITKEKFDELKSLSEKITVKNIMWYINKLSETANIMKQDENKRVQIETCFIRMCMPEKDYSYEGLINRIDILENQIKENSFRKVFNGDTNKNTNNSIEIFENVIKKENIIKKTEHKIENNNLQKKEQNSDKLETIKKQWKEITANATDMNKNLNDVDLEEQNENTINIIFKNELFATKFNNEKEKQKLKEATLKLTHIDINYEIIYNDSKANQKKLQNDEVENRFNEYGLILETEN